jgi:hypothetical protein
VQSGNEGRSGKREEKVEVREDEGSRRCPTIACEVSDKAQSRGQARGGMAERAAVTSWLQP